MWRGPESHIAHAVSVLKGKELLDTGVGKQQGDRIRTLERQLSSASGGWKRMEQAQTAEIRPV